MIKYRPHRSTIEESMKESKTFHRINDMYDYIVKDWNKAGFGQLLSTTDLSIGEPIGDDDRCDWKRVRYVCTKRIGNDGYNIPQCIGMCSLD